MTHTIQPGNPEVVPAPGATDIPATAAPAPGPTTSGAAVPPALKRRIPKYSDLAPLITRVRKEIDQRSGPAADRYMGQKYRIQQSAPGGRRGF